MIMFPHTLPTSKQISRPIPSSVPRSFDDPSRVAMAVKVLPNIWLGDGRAAQSEHFFEKAEITGVLNMTPSVPNKFCAEPTIEYMRIPVYDSYEKRDPVLMYSYLPAITEFIYKVAVIEKRNILVGCHLGRQRSCAAVAAYLMRFYKMTPFEAMEFIVKKKPDAFHYGASVNFAKSLNSWHRKLTGALPEEHEWRWAINLGWDVCGVWSYGECRGRFIDKPLSNQI